MALTVKDVNILSQYISGVMARADHHAGNVEEIALALAGAILWRKDDTNIKVMAHGADTKNVLWVTINGERYAFSYNHSSEKIEMRKGNIQGNTIHEFDNSTPLSKLVEIFKGL
ncbi:hypothetical protein LF048_003519 [Vibrio cholerae]|uniref:Integron cassette protein VCH-CASS1 chain domain-containing protein n=1 Tax=Vibrio cholerae TaxID=666 RepID=C7U313_VIBCL|nr:hypothetical protein [Vibrio cholerae]EIF8949838.1 hypothetical protein [Vibrio cholerae]EJL6695793.1 hypothetical protein [Vibrio cholerae]EJL6912714.1 hypothetical protein [Vibrio cholerae]CBB93061.1 integron gene cassette CASS14 hypothetical protein [Vibrio cholerae]